MLNKNSVTCAFRLTKQCGENYYQKIMDLM